MAARLASTRKGVLSPVLYEKTTGVYAPDTPKLVARRSAAMPDSVPEAADLTPTGRNERAGWRGSGLVGFPL